MDASWATGSAVDLLTELAGGKEQALWGAACSSPCLLFIQSRNEVRSAHLSEDFLILLCCKIITSVFLMDPE